MTDTLFEAVMDARNRGCEDIAKEIAGYLLSWTFKGGKYITGWGVLERGLCASAVIAVTGQDGDVDALKTNIVSRVQADGAPSQDVLDHAARGIRERADSLPVPGHWSSGIEQGISETDHSALASLLEELAAMLSPTAG